MQQILLLKIGRSEVDYQAPERHKLVLYDCNAGPWPQLPPKFLERASGMMSGWDPAEVSAVTVVF